MKNQNNKEEDNKTREKTKIIDGYDKFYNLYCPLLRRHVFHGVKEENGVQEIKCFACDDTYKFHIDGRNKIEKSLWGLYDKSKDKIEDTPILPKKIRKKRWKQKIIIFRGRS